MSERNLNFSKILLKKERPKEIGYGKFNRSMVYHPKMGKKVDVTIEENRLQIFHNNNDEEFYNFEDIDIGVYLNRNKFEGHRSEFDLVIKVHTNFGSFHLWKPGNYEDMVRLRLGLLNKTIEENIAQSIDRIPISIRVSSSKPINT